MARATQRTHHHDFRPPCATRSWTLAEDKKREIEDQLAGRTPEVKSEQEHQDKQTKSTHTGLVEGWALTFRPLPQADGKRSERGRDISALTK